MIKGPQRTNTSRNVDVFYDYLGVKHTVTTTITHKTEEPKVPVNMIGGMINVGQGQYPLVQGYGLGQFPTWDWMCHSNYTTPFDDIELV